MIYLVPDDLRIPDGVVLDSYLQFQTLILSVFSMFILDISVNSNRLVHSFIINQ